MATEEDLLRFSNWRLNVPDRHGAADAAISEAFAQRAAEVRESVEFVLNNGLNEGAEMSLGTLAEEDMSDFCIMVDLAQGLAIPGVEPLGKGTAEHLREFLETEPWHSLLVDNDVTVAIAMLEDVAVRADEGPWYRVCPNMVRVMAAVLDEVNAEQMQRLVGEIEALLEHTGVRLPDDALALVANLVHSNANRLGVRPPSLT